MARKLVGAEAPHLSAGQYLSVTAEIRKANGDKNKAVAAHGDVERRAVKMGFDPKAYKFAQQMMDLGQKKAEAFLARVREYCIWESGGEQLDLFAAAAGAEVEAPPADAVLLNTLMKIREAACEHALEGGTLDDTRYAPGSAEAQAHAEGFRLGEADRAARDKAGDAAPGKTRTASVRKDRQLGPQTKDESKAGGKAGGKVGAATKKTAGKKLTPRQVRVAGPAAAAGPDTASMAH